MGKGVPMKRSALLAVVLALTACGSDNKATDEFSVFRKLAEGGLSVLKPKPPGDATIGLDRARIDSIGLPLLKVDVEKRGAVAVLGLLTQSNGTQTWVTADGITLTLRDGMIIASRGLGDDLMSAAVPASATIARGTGSVERRHYYLFGGEIETLAPFTCALASKGRETLVVYSLSYAVTHVTEACAGTSDGAAVSFTNEYWIEGSGKIRQSRQWLGAGVGFLDLTEINR